MIWLDVLDAPMINHFETMFYEHLDGEVHPVSFQDGDLPAFLQPDVLPDGASGNPNHSSVINYPYAHTRPILQHLREAGRIDKSHGARLRYANPANNGGPMPT